MEQDQELTAANERLLEKRRQLSLTGNHTRRIESTDFNAIAEKCIKIDRERGNVIEFPEREYGQEPEPDTDPNAMLRYIGIPKMYVNCGFENFEGNEPLIEELKAMATGERSLILRGNTGCGKTHLAIAMLKLSPDWKDRFVTVPDLLLKIRGSFNGGDVREEEIIDTYSWARLLVLDDLGAEKTTDFTVDRLHLILDRRIREGLKTIITTNLTQDQIEKTFGARIASRLASMESIKVNMPDRRKVRK